MVPRILDWFAGHARDLPWRRTLDPYAIWVSEIMLQQTQVKTVIPYWERWMCELPNLRALATARPERVLKLWEGLGYYTRARNLHKAARILVANGSTSLPASYDGMLALPGVGRYTAGAISSIAYNHPTPILDGNVIRVLTRVFGIGGDPRNKGTNRQLWELANALVTRAAKHSGFPITLHGAPVSGPCSLLNQALMELGALICTPGRPRCEICPLRRHCVARRENRVHRLPKTAARPKAIERRIVAFVVEHKGRWLVRQRPTGVVNAQLWEFPNIETNGEALSARQLFQRMFGIQPDQLVSAGAVRHTITRYRISLDAFKASVLRPWPATADAGRWVPTKRLESLALTGAHRKLFNSLTEKSS